MTGPEHYTEAERLLAFNAGNRADPSEPAFIAAAQVHATLALAAATALDDTHEWLCVASEASK